MPAGVQFTGHHRAAFLALVRGGRSPRTAADHLGFSWRTVRRHLETDDAFREEFDEAQAFPIAEVEDALLVEAKGGSLGAIKFFLTNKAPARWSDDRSRQPAAVGAGDAGPAPEILVGAVREALTTGDTHARAVGVLVAVPLPDVDQAIEAESTEKD